MKGSYHERSNAAPARGKWTRGFVAVGFALGLGGCSVSMPMSRLMDPTSTAAVGSGTERDAPAEKPAVEVAAARPDM